MPRTAATDMRRMILTLVAAMVSGALAGAAAGWTVAPINAPTDGLPSPAPTQNATTTAPDVNVIPVDRTPQPALIPSPFAERGSSAVATLYRRARAVEENLLTEERMIGQAVAVTSDGWFVVPSSVVQGTRLADLLVWHDGRSATATHAVRDTVSGVIFIKTPLRDLVAPAFARATDVTVGLAAWLERRERAFEPSGIVALREPLDSLDGISSETAARRGRATGITRTGDGGAPLWSANGALIGLVSSAPEEPIHYLPASAWASSLASLLATGEVRHALLGVRAVDLAWARLDGVLASAWPERGALVREDRTARRPAVTPASPAATAGLRAGDVIQRVDRDILDGSADLGELLVEYRPSSAVTLTVIRDGSTLELPVTLGSVVTSEEWK